MNTTIIIPTAVLLLVLVPGCGCQQTQSLKSAEEVSQRSPGDDKVAVPEEDEVDIPENFKKTLNNPNNKACLLMGTISGYSEYPFCSGKTSACGVNPTCKYDSRMRTKLRIPGFRIDKQLLNKHNLKLPDTLDTAWPSQGRLGDTFLILYVLRGPRPDVRGKPLNAVKQRKARFPQPDKKYYLMIERMK